MPPSKSQQSGGDLKHPSITAGIGLFAMLAGLYLLVYNGLWISDDELYLYDATESLVRSGNLELNYVFHLRSGKISPTVDSPFEESSLEPLQPLLSAPLFLFARAVPSIGLIHTVWLFNIFVTLATALVLYAGGLWLGYRREVAWLGALLFGTTTLALPYTRTFFRDPLGSFFALTCFLSAWKIRQHWVQHRPAYRTMVLFLLSIGGLLTSKFGYAALLPGVVFILLPSPQNITRYWRRSLLLFIAAIASFFIIVVIGNFTGIERLQLSSWRAQFANISWQYVGESMLGYQISPGRSLWLFSPVLLFGIAGSGMLLRQGEWRIVAALTTGIILLSMGYGAGRGEVWWGAKSWGPRQMLPVTPLLMMASLPVLDWLLSPKSRWFWKLAATLLVLTSFGVQLLGALVSIDNYYDLLHQESIRAAEEGLWTWRWSPIPRHAALLDLNAPDVAWQISRHDTSVVIIACLALITGGFLLSGRSLFRIKPEMKFLNPAAIMLLVAIFLGGIWSGLYSLRDDPRFRINRLTGQDVMPLIEALEKETTSQDAIFLQANEFQPAFLNYFKGEALVVPLPYAPGENYDPATDTLNMPSRPASELLSPNTVTALDWTANHYQSIWIVVDSSPAVTIELRPTERYMAENYFPLSTIQITDLLRAVQFLPVDSPTGNPENSIAFSFGNLLKLEGYDLPNGATFRAGDIVPVSLIWTPLQPIDKDYIISVQIAPHNAPPVAQRDGIPQGTFGYTSRWQTGVLYRDNYGLRLPENLAAGEYVLQVIIYTYPDIVRLSVLDENSLPVGDVAVLQPIMIK